MMLLLLDSSSIMLSLPLKLSANLTLLISGVIILHQEPYQQPQPDSMAYFSNISRPFTPFFASLRLLAILGISLGICFISEQRIVTLKLLSALAMARSIAISAPSCCDLTSKIFLTSPSQSILVDSLHPKQGVPLRSPELQSAWLHSQTFSLIFHSINPGSPNARMSLISALFMYAR